MTVARPPEEIPPAEELYRGLKPEQIDGPRVLPDAIALQGTSVVRAQYGSPASALAKAKGGTAIGAITPANFPGPIVSDGGVEWEWFPLDLPDEGDDAHAECRLRRTSDRPATDHRRPNSGSFKEKLRKALADRFRILNS